MNDSSPEIMCSSMDCPIKETCQRYMARPQLNQNFKDFEFEGGQVSGSLDPPVTNGVECSFQIPLYEDEYK